jgi:hypothetical protein
MMVGFSVSSLLQRVQIFWNRGFPSNQARSGSSFLLGSEASMDDATLFGRPS